ncbi:hypothetical protein IQ255_12400 [Pleurocapsales cyanobacterium LEGE 10410]|nr:hypothetical protein [Pleurocapsales cyanobacterium LEGE 10410]
MNNLDFLANTLGILAAIASLFALSTTLSKLLKLPFDRRFIWRVARLGLMSTISLGLIHGLLMTQKEELNFWDINTYWVYLGGLFALNLFLVQAAIATELKSDSKLLIYLSYGALFLLACHLGQRIIPLF